MSVGPHKARVGHSGPSFRPALVVVHSAQRASVTDVIDARAPRFNQATVDPPLPARLGARLGLGARPTDGAFVAALRERAGQSSAGKHPLS